MLNELQLSKDLNVITAEINSYKQLAGQAIFEIGKRLKHVKENDLIHGEFGKWLESIEMNRKTAHRFITVYEKLPTDVSSMGHLGVTALYEIATLPQEEREKEHVTSKGETKTVDEMTVKELQEVKRQLRQEKDAREQAERIAENEKRAREQVEQIEPKVIKKEVIKEVDKTDYKRIEKLEKELTRMKMNKEDIDSKEKEVKILMLDASKSVLKTKIEIDNFLEKVAITSYRRGAIAASSESAKNKLIEGLDDLKNFINEMEMAINGTIEHY